MDREIEITLDTGYFTKTLLPSLSMLSLFWLKPIRCAGLHIAEHIAKAYYLSAVAVDSQIYKQKKLKLFFLVSPTFLKATLPGINCISS